MRNVCLIVVVFLCGGAVLALEILGTRILGPFHGVSLFLWSALITVTLAALSLGYALGGRLADRGATFGRLSTLIAVAGAWTLLIPWMVRPALLATEGFGLRLAVLTTAALLFGPPLTLLGTVSPYAIRLRASSLDHVGRTAGNLYAISTVASVVSALAVGFFLIPALGVARLTLTVGLALLAASALAALVARTGRPARVTTAIVLLGVGLLAAGRVGAGASTNAELIDWRDSAYAELKVVDVQGARHLLIDGGVHTIEDLESGDTWHPYAVAVQNARFLFEEPGRLLLIGLGGGSVVKDFAAEGWTIDVVEIDPAVGEMARKHFGLADDAARMFWMDGRRYLRTREDSYDLILVDAFGSSSIPFHLATTEAFALMRERLAPGGVLAINVETLGWHDRLLGGFAASLEPHFDEILALPTSEPPDALGNIILLASDREMAFDEYEKLPRPMHHLDDPHRHWWSLQLTHAWDNRYRPETQGVEPFTDDRSPLDLLSEEVNRQARFALHDYFREAGIEAW